MSTPLGGRSPTEWRTTEPANPHIRVLLLHLPWLFFFSACEGVVTQCASTFLDHCVGSCSSSAEFLALPCSSFLVALWLNDILSGAAAVAKNEGIEGKSRIRNVGYAT